MNVKILHLVEGAKQATGLTVIIDVFRAFYGADFSGKTVIHTTSAGTQGIANAFGAS